ncbi:DUF937 domain-containing protein [Flavobacteriaceae bacterium]|nr:DUF937 domain-containing protein [Flavobacteriaceae bacterium]
MNLLGSGLGKSLIKGLSSQTGQSKSKTTALLNLAIPVMLQAMQRNSANKEGALGLLNAITNKHDGSILNNLNSIFLDSSLNAVEKDGGKILGHVFGKRQKNIQNALSKQTGVSNNSVAKVLKVAAPVVLGILGKQKRNSPVNDTKDLSNMISNLLKSQTKKQSFLEAILDADENGSIINELAGSILKKNNISIGNLLSKLFNKK